MLTIYSNETIGRDGTHIGSYRQEANSTVFYHANGGRVDSGKKFAVSSVAGMNEFKEWLESVLK
jgi:hypothetical protein